MNKNKLFASIKADLKKMFGTEKFSDFVLSDGTKITSTDNDLAVNSEVYKVDEQGNQTPLDDGDYVLEDGRTITVKGNIVTVISEKSTDEQTPIEEPNTDMADETGVPAEPTENGDLASQIADMRADLDALAEIVQNLISGQKGTNDEMMSAINKFGAVPGAKPVEIKRIGYQEYKKKGSTEPISIESFREKLAERAKSINGLNIKK